MAGRVFQAAQGYSLGCLLFLLFYLLIMAFLNGRPPSRRVARWKSLIHNLVDHGLKLFAIPLGILRLLLVT